MFRNTEAGLQIDASVDDPVISDVRTALASWRDPASEMAKRLDATLLNDLLTLGYIFPEKELRKRRSTSSEESKKKRRPAGVSALFKFQAITRPQLRHIVSVPTNVPGTVMLLRARRASESARRTQIQLPIRIVRSEFFSDVNQIVSAHDGRSHLLVQANARGTLNTIKTEIPEIEPMVDPVLRLERTANAIIYQAFDSASVLGRPIRQALENGFLTKPISTHHTIADRDRATWWRFI